uniref:ATP-dependent Clp protease proteolytic subunit n=1 Tax=Mitrastemon kanehirai TaxID=1358725 RepID=A0A4Y1MCC2_9ERIC|nr:clp protease proteolytic subunit [Mitrastemon kanehirai]
MPVGVPKIPFSWGEGEEPSWLDIYNRLYKERLLFLCQDINSEISNQLTGLMLFLNIDDNTKDIFLFINSPGGLLIPGVCLYDTMQFIKSNVQTLCIGLAASLGSFILIGGEFTKRFAFPHARVMIHQPMCWFYETQAGEFLLEAEELLKIREDITKVYAERTGKPLWILSEDMERDSFMSVLEAKFYGIIDSIIVNE